MSIDGLLKDRVTLLKKDGTIFREGIPASVQAELIFINDGSVPVEPGDHILRRLPSNLDEDFIATEATFYNAGSMSHWEIGYRRSNVPLATAQTIVNNITGHNARVNVGSTDNSSNSVVTHSDTLFSNLVTTIQSGIIQSAERDALVSIAEEMRANVSGSLFQECYKRFIASAADHMTIIAPFLPALSQLL